MLSPKQILAESNYASINLNINVSKQKYCYIKKEYTKHSSFATVMVLLNQILYFSKQKELVVVPEAIKAA